MRIWAGIACTALLAGCVTLPPIDHSLPIGPPQKFNADPDRYDHKTVYIRAYLDTSSHWWQFLLYDRPRRRHYDPGCLSFEENDWVMDNRAALNDRFLLLKGTYFKDAIRGSIRGNCENMNYFVMDAEFMSKRYGKVVRH